MMKSRKKDREKRIYLQNLNSYWKDTNFLIIQTDLWILREYLFIFYLMTGKCLSCIHLQSLVFWNSNRLTVWYKEASSVGSPLVFLLFIVSEGLLFVSFFWTSFHSLSSPSLGIWPGEGFYLPDPLLNCYMIPTAGFSSFLLVIRILPQKSCIDGVLKD